MEGTDLLELIKYMGKPTGYLIAFLFTLWILNKVKILPLAIDWLNFKIHKKRAKMHTLKHTKNLELHSVFHELYAWKIRKIKNLNFGSTSHNIVFRDIVLKSKINSIYTVLNTFVKSNQDLNKLNQTEFKALVDNQVDEIVAMYNKDALDLFIKKFDSREKGKEVFEYVMNTPIKGFNAYHERVIQFLLRLITDVCNSTTIYDNNIERYWSILNAYSAALTSTFVDIENVYSLFNGDLEKICEC